MSKQSKQDDSKKRTQLTLERVYYGALAFLFALIIVFNITSSLGTLPGFCGICHGSSHRAWKNSNHASVACNVCHSGSSFFGTLSGRITLTKMIPAQVTSFYRRPVTTTVPNSTCLLCHAYVGTQVIQNEELRVSHKEIIEAKYDCGDCHSTTAHGTAAVRQNFAELGKCLACHNNATASGKCETCHVKEGGFERLARVNGYWQISHGKNWRKTHGMGDITTCQTCHSKLYCSRCHNIELPHSNAWLTTHGRQVTRSKAAAASCKQCHKGALCDSCHKMKMPHPRDFLPKHSKIVKRDGADACYNCHFKQACTKCHKYHTHRGIPQEKLKLLRKEVGLD
ncbi:MAG: hypothetical protein IBX64_07990 [Actinobacteria bacterium]|nr:hypothetical protein [Actinomycetota bacterium]